MTKLRPRIRLGDQVRIKGKSKAMFEVVGPDGKLARPGQLRTLPAKL